MKTWTKQEIFTYLALLVLLAIRVPNTYLDPIFAWLFRGPTLPSWTESLRAIQDLNVYIIDGYFFVFVGIVIIVNRGNLKNLNIDDKFLYVFSYSGLAYCYYFFWPLGWLAAIMSVYMIYLLYKGKYEFGNTDINTRRTITIIVIGFLLGLLFISSSLDLQKIQMAIHWFLIGIPFAAVEEVIFRGLLWMFLKKLNWTDPKIVVAQAILFWLSHTTYFFTEPFSFWVIVPILSVLLGVLTWRTKSITPSTIAHTLINALWSLIAS